MYFRELSYISRHTVYFRDISYIFETYRTKVSARTSAMAVAGAERCSEEQVLGEGEGEGLR